MAKRLKLENENLPGKMIAVSAHADVYRVAWSIGRALNIELKSEGEYVPDKEKPEEAFIFFATSTDRTIIWRLVPNRSGNALLSKKYKQFDYFLFVSQNAGAPVLKSVTQTLKSAENILGSYEAEPCAKLTRILKNYSF